MFLNPKTHYVATGMVVAAMHELCLDCLRNELLVEWCNTFADRVTASIVGRLHFSGVAGRLGQPAHRRALGFCHRLALGIRTCLV